MFQWLKNWVHTKFQSRKNGASIDEKMKFVGVKRNDHLRGKAKENSWYVVCTKATPAFPHSGYLRSDGSWALSMKIEDDDGTELGHGYFKTEAECYAALLKFLET